MKSLFQNIFSTILCLLFVSFATIATGQSDTTTVKVSKTITSVKGDTVITMKVFGICGMCKERIESTALDAAGVKKAEWDIKTDTLVIIGSAKMNKEKIAQALAKAGYKSEVCAADPKGYAKLPACCQYESGLEKH